MTTAADWKLAYEGFVPAEEGLREALCTLGNGYFATRGAVEEASADAVHYPGTYLAGGYNRLKTDIAGQVIENEDLVNFPNWLPLSFRPADNDWLNLQRDEAIDYRQELDLRNGVLFRRFTLRDKAGRETSVESRRLVHMGRPHLAALELTVRPLNWSGDMEVMTALDGRVINAGVARYRQLNSKHLSPIEAVPFGEDGMLLVVETNQSRLRFAEAARTRFFTQRRSRRYGAGDANGGRIHRPACDGVGVGGPVARAGEGGGSLQRAGPGHIRSCAGRRRRGFNGRWLRRPAS